MNGQTLRDEKVLFEKRYCKGSQKSSCEVTVTNKRLVHSFSYKKGSETTEINIDDINGCELKMKKGNPFGAFLLYVGILCLIGGMVSLLTSIIDVEPGFSVTKFIIPIIVGLFLTIVGLILIRKIKLEIAVYVDAVENPMLFCSALTGKSKFIRLKVNRSAAREIITDLTAAVTNAKENK